MSEPALMNDHNKRFQLDDSNITLISSDGFHFKVHRHQIESAGTVFKAMLELDNTVEVSNHVPFLDEKIEDSFTVSLFLDIIYGNELREPKSTVDFSIYENLLHFMIKYDCTPALQYFRHALFHWVLSPKNKIDPMDMFTIGSATNDVELCVAAIRGTGNWQWSTGNEIGQKLVDGTRKPFNFDRGITGASVMELSAWSLTQFCKIPNTYKFALLRAYRYPSNSDYTGSIRDCAKVAEEFEAIMQQILNEKKAKEAV
ncbi:uncharacterized protein IL334_007718 [Kwoniella shivajii]|uniref:BTB domain-containing protein n=1 Tax=Kwoniella shivajii TaxID=564305 RepID=A0ABZ1D9F4_9TREE|nr:hypothetical protein IL334_007718 [Kwoniella shivajii]